MKKVYQIILLAVLLLAGLGAKAYDFKVGGIYYNITSDSTVAIDRGGYASYSGVVTIPTSVKYNNKTYSVTSIGYGAFHNCTGLTSIEIPNSVTSIDTLAFWDCTGLTSIDIPNSVTSIGDYTFYGCTGLTSITIPNSVTSIGNLAFYYCTGLTSIEIPNSVTFIGEYNQEIKGETNVEIIPVIA
ncbi:MAG: leucine-rich repeat domain-containing protein [Bacteroidales bacterium]|nr:leucine-rich repeat domain-containing protein [Bacteroidales bacterium]